jgi:hypothetical protein
MSGFIVHTTYVGIRGMPLNWNTFIERFVQLTHFPRLNWIPRPILNFALGAHFDPRGEVVPQEWILSPRGPLSYLLGWNSLFAPPFFVTVESVHPWGVKERVSIPPGGQISVKKGPRVFYNIWRAHSFNESSRHFSLLQVRLSVQVLGVDVAEAVLVRRPGADSTNPFRP